MIASDATWNYAALSFGLALVTILWTVLSNWVLLNDRRKKFDEMERQISNLHNIFAPKQGYESLLKKVNDDLDYLYAPRKGHEELVRRVDNLLLQKGHR